jgi:hypothetical protein
MEFNDGSQYRVLTNLDAYVGAGRDTYMFRASSATNGVPYTDTQFGHHRSIAAPLRAVIMYQFHGKTRVRPRVRRIISATFSVVASARTKWSCLTWRLPVRSSIPSILRDGGWPASSHAYRRSHGFTCLLASLGRSVGVSPAPAL